MSFSVEIKEQERDGVYVVKPEGRLDTNVHHVFREKMEPILNPGTRIIIFDMSALDYISSAGLAVVFTARKIVEKNGGFIIMTGMKPPVEKVFDIVKDWPQTSVFRSMEEVDIYLDKIQEDEGDQQ